MELGFSCQLSSNLEAVVADLLTVSPLKAIQGDRIRALFASPPQRSPPLRAPRHASTPAPKTTTSTTTQNLKSVWIPTAPDYVPPSQVSAESVKQEAQHETPKVILKRHVLADGNVAFTIGTRTDHVEKEYPFDIPLQDILDYVSPYELTRFETQEFLKEDEKEEEERQLKLLHKPRGRPKKGLHTSFNASPKGLQFATPRTGEKRGRGRPRKFPITVPSFNGPQPVPTTPTTGTATTPVRLSSEDTSDESTTPRRRQYSMITASGLLPPDLSEETSREVSMNRAQPPRIEPLAKRQKTASDTPRASNHRSALMTPIVRIPQTPHAIAISQAQHTPSKTKIVDLESENSESEKVDTVKVQPGVRLDDPTHTANTDKERETLLRQFLARDTRATSTGTTSSSSSDSLMSRAIVAQRTQRLSIHSSNPAKPSSNQPPITKTIKPVRRTISPPQDARENYVAPTKTPTRSSHMRQTMTPHFPYARSTNRIKSTPPKPPPRSLSQSQSTWQPATTIRPAVKLPTQPINYMSSAPSIKQSQDAIAAPTRLSRFKIRPLEPTNDIRKYFRPRYNPLPTQECADSADEDSEDDGNKGRVNTRNGGLFRSKYTPVKQGSGSEYEDTDEEEKSDDAITHNSSRPTPPPPQTSNVMVARQDTSLTNRHQQPPTLKKEEDDNSDLDPIDLIPRSTIPSPPAPHTHPVRPPTNPTLMAIDLPVPDSESGSEQEYLSAAEPELEPSINISSFSRDINIHTGAELDADTEEDSEEEEEEDGVGSADEVLVGGRGLGR